MGWRALLRQRVRSSLTIASIAVGAFAMVFMSSLAEGGMRTISNGFEELGGTRLIQIASEDAVGAGERLESFRRGFVAVDRDRLLADVPHVVERALYTSMGWHEVSADSGRKARTTLLAADAGALSLFALHAARGRSFTDEEERVRANVCLVAPKVAARLWPDEDAIGRWLTIDRFHCRVVGQLEDHDRLGAGFGFEWLDVVVTPIAALATVDANAHRWSDLLVKTDDPAANDRVVRVLEARLAVRHRGIRDFEIRDLARVTAGAYRIFAIMKVLVALIAAIALVVGGVGVMNMMLVSVSERVREIGVLKAIGAEPRDIGRQFLVEALLLSGSGGLAGAGGGVALAVATLPLIRNVKPVWVGGVAWDAVTIALVSSAIVGVVFGYAPAKRAARLDVIEALRR
jgi:putative ABC transport system permease protein